MKNYGIYNTNILLDGNTDSNILSVVYNDTVSSILHVIVTSIVSCLQPV